MQTRMHQLPPRYLQIFYAIQKVLQREKLQNSTMNKRSPQEQHQAPSYLQTNQSHKPYSPTNSAFANKPQKATHFFNPNNITSTPTNYNTYSHNPIPPFSHSWTSNSPNQNSEQPLSPRHNHSRQHTTVQSPSHPPQYYRQNHQPIAKIESNMHDHFYFLYKKIITYINWTTQQEKMVQRKGGNKFTGEKQE